MVAASEWARICGNVTKEEKKIVNDREELHERSKAIVKNWENTIEVGVIICLLLLIFEL